MKKNKFGIITEELFRYSLITYILLLIGETIKEGFVTFFLNLNYLLAIVLISGLLMAIFSPEWIKKRHKKFTERDNQWILLFCIGGGFLVYYKTKELGDLALIYSLFTVILLFFLTTVIPHDSADE
jgi:hypothetical protein